jgi:hypothetical protein
MNKTPVTNGDIKGLKKSLKYSKVAMMKLFGISQSRWKTIINGDDDEPVSEPAIAILYRLYEKYPETLPCYSLSSLIDQINSLIGGSAEGETKRSGARLKTVSGLIGRESSASYRILNAEERNQEIKPLPVTHQTIAVLHLLASQKKMVPEDLLSLVEKEFKARVDSLSESGDINPSDYLIKDFWNHVRWPVAKDENGSISLQKKSVDFD